METQWIERNGGEARVRAKIVRLEEKLRDRSGSGPHGNVRRGMTSWVVTAKNALDGGARYYARSRDDRQ